MERNGKQIEATKAFHQLVHQQLLSSSPVQLVPQGFRWKYLDDDSDPGALWKDLNFDDSNWSSGIAQFGYGDSATRTTTQSNRVDKSRLITTYFRRSFAWPDVSRFTNLYVKLLADDGGIVYLNGKEIYRSNMPTGRVSHSTLAFQTAPEPAIIRTAQVDPSRLRTGKNVIASEIHQITTNSTDMIFDLELLANTPPLPTDPANRRDKEFLESLHSPVTDNTTKLHLDYMEGRMRQVAEDHPAAIEKFRAVLKIDQSHAEPFLRLAESWQALQRPHQALEVLEQALVTEMSPPQDLIIKWLEVSRVDLKRTPPDCLAALKGLNGTEKSGVNDIKWLLDQLLSQGTIRINCGGPQMTDSTGSVWGRDRFYRDGYRYFGDGIGGATKPFTDPIGGTDNDSLYQTERWFPSQRRNSSYAIPLPLGTYQITLHFAEIFLEEPGSRIFDVNIEDTQVLRNYEPLTNGFATASSLTFTQALRSDVLNITFHQRRREPKISAIEIKPLPSP